MTIPAPVPPGPGRALALMQRRPAGGDARARREGGFGASIVRGSRSGAAAGVPGARGRGAAEGRASAESCGTYYRVRRYVVVWIREYTTNYRASRRVFFVSARRRRRAVSHRFRVRESRPLCVLQLLTSPISARSTWSSWSSTLASASACFVPDGPSAAARLRALESRAVARAPSVPAEALSPVSNLPIACCAFAPPPGACAPPARPRARRDAVHARTLGGRRAIAANCRRPRGRHRRVGFGTNLATSKPFSFSLSAV